MYTHIQVYSIKPLTMQFCHIIGFPVSWTVNLDNIRINSSFFYGSYIFKFNI